VLVWLCSLAQPGLRPRLVLRASAVSAVLTLASAATAVAQGRVTGNIVAHQREDYFTFRDRTGEIRVEIGSSVWQNRKIDPETRVRLLGEIDSGPAGRYLYVKSLTVVD